MLQLREYLKKVKDHRRLQGQRFKIEDILFATILAILSGAKSYRDVERFCKEKLKTLNDLFGFKWKSWPKKSNLSKIFNHLNKESVEDVFRECSQDKSSLKNVSQVPQIAIDGKVLRGSFDNLKDSPQLHLLSLFSVEDKIILGHVEISEKTNEIPTAQEIIKKLGLPEGVVYTLDALHCQKKTFEVVKEAKGNLVTQVKKIRNIF